MTGLTARELDLLAWLQDAGPTRMDVIMADWDDTAVVRELYRMRTAGLTIITGYQARPLSLHAYPVWEITPDGREALAAAERGGEETDIIEGPDGTVYDTTDRAGEVIRRRRLGSPEREAS